MQARRPRADLTTQAAQQPALSDWGRAPREPVGLNDGTRSPTRPEAVAGIAFTAPPNPPQGTVTLLSVGDLERSVG